MNLIRFLCNEWTNIYFRLKLEETEMYLAYDEECFRVTTENVAEMSYLRCNHEEADTRIFLHAKDASQSKDAVAIICEDTYVFSIAISKADIIGVPIYMKRYTQNRTRFVILPTFPLNLEVIFPKAFQEYMPSLGVTLSVHLQGKEKWLP